PTLVFELVDGVLELQIQHDTVGDNNNAVKDASVCGIVQGREPMREPTNCVALAASGRVFYEIVVTNAFAACGVHELSYRLELVVPREDHRLDFHFAPFIVALLLDLEMDEAREEVEETVTAEYFFPQVSSPICTAGRVGRV